jgi:dienelactone hydrolase
MAMSPACLARRAALLLVLLPAGCGGTGSSRDAAKTPAPRGSAAPRVTQERIAVAASDGQRIRGLLFRPGGPRRPAGWPAVLYLHGGGADKSDIAPEARLMAGQGVLTVAIDAADVRSALPPASGLRHLRADRALREQTVDDLGRVVRWLAARRDVDRRRIAFEGFSRGAYVGALFAAQRPPVAAFVFVSGGANPDGLQLRSITGTRRAEATAIARSVDPRRALPRAAAAARYLVQFGLRDSIIPRRLLLRFAGAVPRRHRRIEAFQADHPLDEVALARRQRWLSRVLHAHPRR